MSKIKSCGNRLKLSAAFFDDGKKFLKRACGDFYVTCSFFGLEIRALTDSFWIGSFYSSKIRA